MKPVKILKHKKQKRLALSDGSAEKLPRCPFNCDTTRAEGIKTNDLWLYVNTKSSECD